MTTSGPESTLPDDAVIVAHSLDETDQARALIEERPGIGIGAACWILHTYI